MILKIQCLILVCVCLCFLDILAVKRNLKRSQKKHVKKNAKPVKKNSITVKQLKRQGEDTSKKYSESEPGFDLTPEEQEKFHIWKDGVVPYYIDQVSYDKVNRDKIRTYLDNVGGLTGLTFSEMIGPPSNDSASRWAFFINRKGLMNCVDHSAKDFSSSGVQKVILGYDCLNTAELILALLGVPPQHNAPNRDDYIDVQQDNIVPDKSELFKKLDNKEWLFHDVDYDFNSAGHFDFHRHTSNGAATIKPKGIYPDNVGEAKDFSEADLWKIHMLYNYITAKKKDDVDECDILFDPGDDINKASTNDSTEIKPRKKPNKYLGLPDDASQETDTEKGKDDGKSDLDLDTDPDTEKADDTVEQAADEVVSAEDKK